MYGKKVALIFVLWTTHGTNVCLSKMPHSALRKAALRWIKQKRDVTLFTICI